MTSLSPVDIANLALARCGAQRIVNLTDPANTSAVLVNGQFQFALQEVSRASKWGCLMTAANLVEITQTPIAGSDSTATTATVWAPFTTYAALAYVTYDGITYQVAYNYTSSNSFYTDLTAGALTQQVLPSQNGYFSAIDPGSQYPSSWAHQWALPSDFILLSTLNDSDCWNYLGQGTEWEIMGASLFTNASQAVIKYVRNVTDTTLLDPLFTAALVALLASKLVTTLRLDSGNMAETFLAEYQRVISQARAKDGDQARVRRFNPINTSTFIGSRYGGILG